MSRRRVRTGGIIEAKKAEQRQMEEAILAQMYADRRNIWLSQLNPIQEQLLNEAAWTGNGFRHTLKIS